MGDHVKSGLSPTTLDFVFAVTKGLFGIVKLSPRRCSFCVGSVLKNSLAMALGLAGEEEEEEER